jgi:hypothetical protein
MHGKYDWCSFSKIWRSRKAHKYYPLLYHHEPLFLIAASTVPAFNFQRTSLRSLHYFNLGPNRG